MKSVLLSIAPKWCEMIMNEKKTIEVRKTKPKIDVPFKCYIYCTRSKTFLNWHNGIVYTEKKDLIGGRGNGIYYRMNRMVVGEFVCRNIDFYDYSYEDGVEIDDDLLLDTRIAREEINIYAKGKTLYGWHISDLVIYDKPKKLSQFSRFGADCKVNGCFLERPPQSWCYVESL